MCDNTFQGGLGYTPREVGDMTLDMIFMLLCDKANLRSRGLRLRDMETLQVSVIAKDGLIRGRDRDGNPIMAGISGKSLARQMMEESEQ